MNQTEETRDLIMHQVKFNEDVISVIEEDGEPYVAMKPISEGIDLTWNSQFELIKRDPVLSAAVRVIRTVAFDGKSREMTCLPLKYLNGWLFKLDAARYEGDRRDRIIRYQKECYDVLFKHFFGDPDRTYATLMEMQEKIAQLEVMISPDLPIEIFHYNNSTVRMVMLHEQPGLYAPDILHIIDGNWRANNNQAPSRLTRMGLTRDKHYLVTSIGRVATHLGLTPDYLLARMRVSGNIRGMTFVLPHGMSLLRNIAPDLYQWYCNTVFPALPRAGKIYDRRCENLALTEGIIQ